MIKNTSNAVTQKKMILIVLLIGLSITLNLSNISLVYGQDDFLTNFLANKDHQLIFSFDNSTDYYWNNLTLSKDGNMLVFTTNHLIAEESLSQQESTRIQKIWVYDIRNDKISELEMSQDFTFIYDISFSPNNERLLFTGVSKKCDGIHIFDIEKKDLTCIDAFKIVNGVDWFSDDSIAVLTKNDAGYDIAIKYELNSKEITPITSIQKFAKDDDSIIRDEMTSIKVSGDNKKIALSISKPLAIYEIQIFDIASNKIIATISDKAYDPSWDFSNRYLVYKENNRERPSSEKYEKNNPLDIVMLYDLINNHTKTLMIPPKGMHLSDVIMSKDMNKIFYSLNTRYMDLPEKIPRGIFTTNIDITQPTIVQPLKQFNSGISFNEIQCKQHLILIQKYDDSPACVTESTKEKLIERGWAKTMS